LATDANFQVEGTTTAEQFVVLKNGNVGIGTTRPKSKLDVAGLGGLVVGLGNIDGVSNATLLPFTNTQQLLLGWNRSGGAGEINFLNSNNDGLSGGFNWANLNQDGSTTSMAWLNNSGLAINNIQAGAATDAVVVADANGLLRKVSASAIGNDGDAWGVTGEDTTSAIGRTGSVGIGTTGPVAKLDVENGGDLNQLRVSTGSGAINRRANINFASTFGTGTDTNVRRTADILSGFKTGDAWGSEFMSFNVGNNGAANDANELTSEKVRIQGNGNVGIGTTTPGAKIEVNGFIKVGSSATTGAVKTSNGMIKFNSATSKFQGFDGTAWVDLH